MRRLFIGSFLVFLVAGSIIGYRYVSTTYEVPFVPHPSSATLQPPREAAVATLVQATGTVKHWVRGAQEATPATPSGMIVQGESILTEDGSATITLPNLGTIILEENTQIHLVNLVPSMLVISQSQGTASYTTTTHPFSIRTGNALIHLTGDVTISRDTTHTISVTRGSATLAILSDENETNVWDIGEGQTARVSGRDTVTIR